MNPADSPNPRITAEWIAKSIRSLKQAHVSIEDLADWFAPVINAEIDRQAGRRQSPLQIMPARFLVHMLARKIIRRIKGEIRCRIPTRLALGMLSRILR